MPELIDYRPEETGPAAEVGIAVQAPGLGWKSISRDAALVGLVALGVMQYFSVLILKDGKAEWLSMSENPMPALGRIWLYFSDKATMPDDVSAWTFGIAAAIAAVVCAVETLEWAIKRERSVSVRLGLATIQGALIVPTILIPTAFLFNALTNIPLLVGICLVCALLMPLEKVLLKGLLDRPRG